MADPLLNEYDAAPLGVITNGCPEHTVPLFTETTGKACTVTLAMAGAEERQPAALVPLTVKEEVEVGLTTEEPPAMVYEAAPAGVMVKNCPAQMVPLFTVSAGREYTVTCTMAGLEVHPWALLPVTE